MSAPKDSQRPTHLSDDGSSSQMVDVGGKPASRRMALAAARLVFPPEVSLATLLSGGGPKGPLLEVARVAGILAAKRTGDLIPMCHPLALHHVGIDFEELPSGQLPSGFSGLEVRCQASCTGPTGVEMEAMTGASVAALTVYDMAKALSKGIRIEAVRLLRKSGGKSGDWCAEGESDSE